MKHTGKLPPLVQSGYSVLGLKIAYSVQGANVQKNSWWFSVSLGKWWDQFGMMGICFQFVSIPQGCG